MSRRIRRVFRGLASVTPVNAWRLQLLRLGGVSLGRGVRVSRGTRLGDGARIGDSVKIGPGVTVGAGVTMGDGAQVRTGSCIGEDCVLASGVVISDFALVGNAVIGENSFIERGVVMTGFQNGRISIGKHCYIGIGDVLDWSGGLEIGNYVHVAGPATGIWTHSSVMSALKGKELCDHSEHLAAAVKIGDRVWIGGNSTIYPGTVIESFSVVLPNSVVSAPVRSGTMVGGAPALLKKTLKQEADRVTFQTLDSSRRP